jgi:hypothetical protein
VPAVGDRHPQASTFERAAEFGVLDHRRFDRRMSTGCAVGLGAAGEELAVRGAQ